MNDQVTLDAETLQRMMEMIYSRCRRMLGDPEQAWDALQEVFVRFYESANKQAIHQPLHFLYRTSTNHCIDLLRTKGRTFPLDEQALAELPSKQTHQGEERVLVNKLIQRFGKDEVEMLTYRYVDQMTYREIARVYHMSDRGVQKKLERIEDMMRKYLNR